MPTTRPYIVGAKAKEGQTKAVVMKNISEYRLVFTGILSFASAGSFAKQRV